MRKFSRLIIMMTALSLIISSAYAQTIYRTLRSGETSTDVATMQQALIDLSFLKGTADGKYGTNTENAVRSFQKRYKLKIDGVAGNGTLTLLYEKAGLIDSTSTQAPASAIPAPEVNVTPSPTSSTTSSTSVSYATLKQGSTGDSVKTLQIALNSIGYPCGTVDGKFGKATYNAVRSFQQSKELKADGKAGRLTLTALYAVAGKGQSTDTPTPVPTPVPTESTAAPIANTSTKPTQTLRLGMRGDDVKHLQQKLNEKGYSVGNADGIYGSKTVQAVKALQKANKLSVDGIAGTKTYDVLWADSAPIQTPSTGTSYPSLSVGSNGSTVKALQKALSGLGYEVSSDGVYGGQTKIAVTAFQKQNNLTQSGTADSQTQQLLYSGNAQRYVAEQTDDSNVQIGGGPSKSDVQLLHWFDTVKPSLKGGRLFVYDPATNINWSLRIMSNGNHCDAEPLTQSDTDSLYKAFGNKNTWTPKPVYVKLPDGRWTLATTHNVPHLSGSIKDNGFDGHLCVHFLRDMSEAKVNDPDYGVTNQNKIRSAWKSITGIEYQEKD